MANEINIGVDLPLSRVTLRLKVLSSVILPPYKGSALRGGFGHAFRKIVCALKRKDCVDCLLKHQCAYSYVFETPPPLNSERMRKYPRAPHPFVIEPPDESKQIYEPGEMLQFDLILIGRGRDYFPYFVYTFEELGSMGIGKGRGKYLLEEIWSNNDMVYSSETKTLRAIETLPPIALPENQFNTMTLHFKTPTRIVFGEQLSSSPDFHIIVRNLLRRVSSLAYFHNGLALDVDFKGIIQRAETIRTFQKELKWIDWERYSARQDTRMKLGGFIGKMTFEGDLTSFISLMRLGEQIHVGKATSFGLGKYRMVNDHERENSP